ncbi:MULTISPECIES: hypothetical protein [unclassified Luteococcus]|uniref:hypothetical protein n=1 Tax=unclassified Luteococcus TaxID=2639923 RepID=UPI00313A9636
MRTTLSIDDDVLESARQIASAQRTTTGAVISELARRALLTATPISQTAVRNGFPVLPHRGGRVTSELVDDLMASDS